MKTERGITLPILVVTIIILSILIGITVRQLTISNTGLINSVKSEIEYHEEQRYEEEDKMDNVISSYEQEWGLR